LLIFNQLRKINDANHGENKKLTARKDLRNVAIIAHVDHGKTTLVNEMLKQGGIFRENQQVMDRVMDSNDLERERGITILAKNTSVFYKGVKINIVDTPGHADFGGEVERVLKMVNGVLVLVDAVEGPMPQTRFVMQKALELGHRLIIVVNKIDRPDARLNQVENEILDLLLELNASEDQFSSPIIYCSGKKGTASTDWRKQGDDLTPLFEAILNHFPPVEVKLNAPFQMLVSSIDYNDFVGRIAIGRIERGEIKMGDQAAFLNYNNPEEIKNGKIVSLYQIDGLTRRPVEKAIAGDIVCVSGLENVGIGDTICSPKDISPIKFVEISQPTVEMTFSVNDSPLAGREGKYVTTRHLRDRLFRETLKDVSLKVDDTDSTDSYRVCGRGEMHLSILIENMRRDNYEFQVGPPRVLYKTIDGVKYEPIEKLVVDVPTDKTGAVFQSMGERKGELLQMENLSATRVRMEFAIPVRGLFGYKSQFMTDTRGEGVFNTIFYDYMPYKGEVSRRVSGSLVAYETGVAVTYGLFNAQSRGRLFIEPNTDVYQGMVVGENPKNEDVVVNVCKKKHLTNTRASGSDDALRLEPPKKLSLEEAMEFIADDEILEITPKNIRIRKKILNTELRLKAQARAKKVD